MMIMGCYDMFQRMNVEASQSKHGGRFSHRTRKPRDRESAYEGLMHDYYPPSDFRN